MKKFIGKQPQFKHDSYWISPFIYLTKLVRLEKFHSVLPVAFLKIMSAKISKIFTV